jgi:hypothetical protein
MKMIERQVIITWFTPEERVPEEDILVVATISGKAGNVKFDHAMVMLYWCKGEGWWSPEYVFETLTVHAWCDLEPYKG